MSAPSSPIPIVTAGDAPISVATTLFRHRGSLHVTVIVKARFAFAPEGPATIAPARFFGWSDVMGTIEKGKEADIVAVPGDPLEDIHATEKVFFVMKGGKIWKTAQK